MGSIYCLNRKTFQNIMMCLLGPHKVTFCERIKHRSADKYLLHVATILRRVKLPRNVIGLMFPKSNNFLWRTSLV